MIQQSEEIYECLRIRIENILLGDLGSGQTRELTGEELENLKKT